MKVENQNVEFKESWRDEYIKWICGFANAQGGSGSTKQLLQGAALTSFLLQKTGKKWDSVPIDGVSVSDLDKESFDIFRREALRSGRMSNDDLKLTDEQLLDNLNLLDAGKLKRAAILLFHRRPEKWITGAFVKIGYFDNDADLRYQDEIQGSLMIQADRVIELIYTKYLKAEISYDNITRIEHYPFPKDAIREAVFNALIHQDFAASIPVQISVYEDKLYISNDCVFPQNWTVETLLQKHRSLPHNPDIANAFFRAGFIESWGRGIEKICTLCKNYGIPEPKYTIHPQDIMALFTTAQKTNKSSVQSSVQIVELFKQHPTITVVQVAEILNLSERAVYKQISKLRQQNLIKHIGANKGGHWEVIQNTDEKGNKNR